MSLFIRSRAVVGLCVVFAWFVLASPLRAAEFDADKLGEIRKAIIEADLVDCMVAMPGQLFYSTQIPVCLWFLAKNKAADAKRGFRDRRKQTLFIDARKLGTLVDRVHRELTDADLDKITERLIAVKPNLRALHGETGACRTDLANQDAWVVWGCSSEQTSIAMREANYDVALTIPKQGGAMWTESLQIVKGTQNLATAKAYLNYMTSPEALIKFAWGRQKIMVTNAKIMDLLTPEQIKILNLDKVEEWGSGMRLNKAPVDEEGWKRAWQTFKAA